MTEYFVCDTDDVDDFWDQLFDWETFKTRKRAVAFARSHGLPFMRKIVTVEPEQIDLLTDGSEVIDEILFRVEGIPLLPKMVKEYETMCRTCAESQHHDSFTEAEVWADWHWDSYPDHDVTTFILYCRSGKVERRVTRPLRYEVFDPEA